MPSCTASITPWRSTASAMARRTRTSLKDSADARGVVLVQHVEEPRERLRERDALGRAVGRLHLGDGVEHVGVRVALHGAEALEAVDDVLGRHLAYVVSFGWLHDSARSPSILNFPGAIAGPALWRTRRLWVNEVGTIVL